MQEIRVILLLVKKWVVCYTEIARKYREEKGMNKIGFGFLRLPQVDGAIDYDQLCMMVDAFLDRGGRYFDTAYNYLKGQSEVALRKTLVERHPRDRFEITDKLPTWALQSHEDCRRYYETQLQRCGLEHFDTYFLHWLNEEFYAQAQEYGAFSFLQELKEQGQVKKIGFSYHDSAELLDEILTAHPEIDYVQLQLNYLDWDSPGIQGRRCYETAVRHGKQVIVMEPVKGGSLAALPEEAEQLLKSHRPEDSIASWAIRFAQTPEHVHVVLSGMSDLTQVLDNMVDRPPVSEEEQKLLQQICRIKNADTAIGCTGCSYCAEHCPQKIAIPQYFALYNEYCRKPQENWKLRPAYLQWARTRGKASDCLGCGACEEHCPQKLPICQWMPKVAEAMEQELD